MIHIEDTIIETAKQRLGASEALLNRVTLRGEVSHYAIRARVAGLWQHVGRHETLEGLLKIVEALPVGST